MSKNLQDLQWASVSLEGFPATVSDKLHGFVGLEECTDYGFEKETKNQRKKKLPKKRKNKAKEVEKEVPNKKIKLSNGFIVESCNSATPSLTNENSTTNNRNLTKKQKKAASIATKEVEVEKKVNCPKKKTKLGEDISQTFHDLSPEDMLTWAEFKLPEPILKALAELGFKQPTKIQQLTLPAAIHGRRDILGAAETGSGKTLAFGLPILTGIMKLKEKVAKGFDPYDIPYKKSSHKKKAQNTEEITKGKQKNKGKTSNTKDNKAKNETKDKSVAKDNTKAKNKSKDVVTKESSEDGYSSGEESSEEDEEVKEDNTKKKTKKVTTKTKKSKQKDDDFIEEYEVPLRKQKVASEDEGNDSDDDENYIHLSDILDADDLTDASSEEGNDDGSDMEEESDGESNQENSDNDGNPNSEEDLDDEENSESDGNSGSEEKSDDELEQVEDDGSGDEDVENEGGVGCVKVIDDIELPGQVGSKTGKPLYALIVTPTRELAIQISRHLTAAAKYTGIKIATIVGGMAEVKQERVLRGGPEVVVATPGRLWELLSQGQPHLQQMSFLKFLAIDETDRMIERGHFEELQPLLERINSDEERKSTRQNFVFSATLTLVHDLPSHMQGKKVTKRGKILNRRVEKMTAESKVKRLIQMIGMTEPKVVDITQQNLGTAETLTESKIACPLEQKDAYLYYIFKRHPGRTIVFCNSINNVKRLARLLGILKCRPLPLHANMEQKQRLRNLERFRDDPHGVLIATDVAARGLDIPDVDHVIHYQVPRTAENYVHRSGRTARATKEGLTILMMEPTEVYSYMKLCRTLNKTSEVPTFPVPPTLLSPFKDIVSLAREIEGLELKHRRATQAEGWREKMAREMDIIIDDDVIPVTKVDSGLDKAIKVKKRQLDSMLTRPMFPKGFSYKYPTLNDTNALSWTEDNALQVMKNAIQSGELKKEKRKSKNAPLLKLQKTLKNKKQ